MSEETNTVNKNAFFEKQMIGGCIVEVFGTYEEDGDFGTFSTKIGELKVPRDMTSYVMTEAKEEYLESLRDFYKKNDEMLLSVDFTIREVKE